MEATFFSCSAFPRYQPSIKPSTCRRHGISRKVFNAGKDEYYRGKLVDESMIVLRMRIKEMKMLETGQTPPSNWMEWEKRYFARYNEDVCEAIGMLQLYLMNTRPSLALGMLAIVALSVPISTSFVIFNVVEIARRLFEGFSF